LKGKQGGQPQQWRYWQQYQIFFFLKVHCMVFLFKPLFSPDWYIKKSVLLFCK